ncbi:MAG TPA: hypothetical protein VFE37_15865 [Chloroflexota bacterium]|nr:hypothetical protein [Chloroflexota bacterium]
MEPQAPPPPRPATDRWKRALGRMLDSRGFTVDEWRHANLAAYRPALIATVRHILERLRLEATQADLLERDTLGEDWDPWLVEQYGVDSARVLQEASPAEIAYGIRWCEILLDRHLDVEELATNPPEPVIQWTRDVE